MSRFRLELFGTGWCTKSAALRNFLQSQWVEFDDYNVETNPEAEAKVRSLYDGHLKFPTLIYGSEFLKNPTLPDLKEFLKRHQLID